MVLGIGEGSIEITLDKQFYKPGETIKGTATLALNEALPARQLLVGFYGELERRTGKQRHIDRIFEVQNRVSGEKIYNSGEAFNFEIIIPANALQKSTGGIFGFLSFLTPAPRWFVHAYLDMPMKFDVSRKMQIQLAPAISQVPGV